MASINLFMQLASELELLTPSVKSVYSEVLNSLSELSLDQIWSKQSLARASNENRFILFCILLKIKISGIDLWEQIKTHIENALHIINDLTNQQEDAAKVIDIILCRAVQNTEKLSEIIEICQKVDKLKNILKTLTTLQSANHQALTSVLKEISGRESNLFYDDYINLLNNIITLKSLGVEFFDDSFSVTSLAVNFLLNQNAIRSCKSVCERNMGKEIILFNLIKKFDLDEGSNENFNLIKQNYPAEEPKVPEVINPMLFSINRDEISWDGHPKNQKKFEGKNLISYIYQGNYKSKIVCIKIYVETTPNQGDFSVAEKEIQIYEILSKLSSEYCFLVYYGTCIFKDNNNATNISLVMQWVDKSLAKYIEDLSKPIPEKLLKNIYTKLLNSYHVLRNYDIYHLDVKPQNILIDDSDCNNLKLYIIDFDVSELDIIERTKSITVIINSKAVGTVNYAHPCIRKALHYRNNKFILEYHRSDADIYSLGMTFLHLALLKNFKDKLNKDKNHEKLKEAINSIEFYWARDLITEMLKSKDKNATNIGKCKCFLPGEKTYEI
ncbi:hypothetical protein SteCoe_6205 [Stentor coeruleus]|uniref:mitogen-activated protein kinase kinase n=1 Tax=Stentor coeruleus TaxID=5963 RepID=A0A1R2CQN5_9CILI|nr:hypothetical protein SteCoe_6205 [Stentor coeruleus]